MTSAKRPNILLICTDQQRYDSLGCYGNHVVQTPTIDRLAVATSFQSSGLVILHLLRGIRPDLPVLFLDTGYHFARDL